MPSRYWPTALGLLAAVVLGWYLFYTELLVREMKRDVVVHSRIYSRVLHGLNDPSEGAGEQTLLQLSEDVQDLGIPIIVTDPEGVPALSSNLDFAADPNDPAGQLLLYQYARELAKRNAPIVEPGVGTIYFGDPPLVRRLRALHRRRAGGDPHRRGPEIVQRVDSRHRCHASCTWKPSAAR